MRNGTAWEMSDRGILRVLYNKKKKRPRKEFVA